jgi:hypothetical protein
MLHWRKIAQSGHPELATHFVAMALLTHVWLPARQNLQTCQNVTARFCRQANKQYDAFLL